MLRARNCHYKLILNGLLLPHVHHPRLPPLGAGQSLKKKTRGSVVSVDPGAEGFFEEPFGFVFFTLLEGGESLGVDSGPFWQEGVGSGTKKLVDTGDIPPPLDAELSDAAGAEFVLDEAGDVLAQQDGGAKALVELFEPRRDIDGISDEGVVDVFGAADVPGDDFPEVQADSCPERLAAHAEVRVEVELPCRSHGLDDRVFVMEGNPPGGKDGVADEFDDDPVVLENLVGGALEVVV